MKIKEIHGVPIARWSYEQAFCTDFIISFERDDDWREIESFWARTFGTYADNKTTYKIESDGRLFYVTFHDCTVYLGLNVRPYRGGELVEPKKPVK